MFGGGGGAKLALYKDRKLKIQKGHSELALGVQLGWDFYVILPFVSETVLTIQPQASLKLAILLPQSPKC